MKTSSFPLNPAAKAVLTKRQLTRPIEWKFYSLGILPTLVVMALAVIALHFTRSGYSVIIIMLLAVVLYTAYRSGTVLGLLSSVLVVILNFYIVAEMASIDIFTLATLQRGGVIATVFPSLAFIIGRLKSRNDALFYREQTARVKAEESAQQLQFMAESMPQKIFTNLPSGKMVYVNDQWSDYTGESKKAMKDWGKLIHPHDLKENAQQWEDALANGTPFQFEHRLRRSDGRYIWHLTRAKPLRDKKGKITLWIGSSTDIEDVRRARKLEANTARLMKQRAELMELNKAKDEFISLASHQLRTPATGVKQYVNMAIDGYGGKISPNVRMLLEKANSSNERQLSVINDLLQVAQIDAGKVVLRKEPVDINEMIANIVQEQRLVFKERQQTISYTPKQKRIVVQADPTKLRMIIENVIDNASKYSYKDSAITITVTKYRGQVRVAVKDHGVGIDKADREKVFEKFIRIDNPLSTIVGGNGLGLYWVRKVVELHGGTILVSPNHDAGSTFTITLPAGN